MYVGLHLNKCLSLREHIEHVVKKVNNFFNLIYKVSDRDPRECLLKLDNTFVESIMSYGILAYGSAAKPNVKKLRLISGDFYDRYSSTNAMNPRMIFQLKTNFLQYLSSIWLKLSKKKFRTNPLRGTVK